MRDKLILRYPGVEQNVGALWQRYKTDNGLLAWEAWVAHIAAASALANVGDDANAFWTAFVP